MSREAVRVARAHYENFPVLSRLLPERLRRPVAVVYAFARATDELGDEGSATREERLAALDEWERRLDAALTGRACWTGLRHDGVEHPPAGGQPQASGLLDDLAREIRRYDLPVICFKALITANRMDQLQRRYAAYADLLAYCSASANPIGRIVLQLFGSRDATLLAASDAVCTGLQLANHWQGIGEDLRLRDRCYVPNEDLQRFEVREADLRRDRPSRNVRRLIGFECDRARALLHAGSGLPSAFGASEAAVLRLFIGGGHAILDELERRPQDVLCGGIRVRRARALLAVGVESLRQVAAAR